MKKQTIRVKIGGKTLLTLYPDGTREIAKATPANGGTIKIRGKKS